MASHDIFSNSNAWERVSNGVPQEITDRDLRRIFHDYAQLMTVLANHSNELLDERDRIHVRIDKRNSMHADLEHRLFDSEEGVMVKTARKEDLSKLTAILWGTLSALAASAILLGINLAISGNF